MTKFMHDVKLHTSNLQEQVNELRIFANYFNAIGLDKAQDKLRKIAKCIESAKVDIVVICANYDKKGIRDLREEIKLLLDI